MDKLHEKPNNLQGGASKYFFLSSVTRIKKPMRPWERQRERLKRRQDGVLSGCLVSTQSSVLSTGGCGGFIRLHIPSPCTWVTGPCSQHHTPLQSSTGHPTPLSPIWPPESNKRCPPVIWVQRKRRREGEKLKSGIPHQILRGPWALIIQSLSFQLGWSLNE